MREKRTLFQLISTHFLTYVLPNSLRIIIGVILRNRKGAHSWRHPTGII